MAYPDLPASPTFWCCPTCGNETQFRASGTATDECMPCGRASTVDELLAAHASAHPVPATEAAAH